MAAPHSIPSEKAAARRAALAARAGQDPALGARLAGRFLDALPLRAGAVVSGFWPLDGEIDLRPLLHALDGRGHPIVLPVTPPRGHPLRFARWRPGDALVPGRFGTLHPVGHPTGEDLVPDVLLVPLLAFDARGNRLGYGGGYYDRTLAALPGRLAVGCAFAAQEVASVPVEPTDIRLDAVATERGVLMCPERPALLDKDPS